jgi:hypothetical protein
VSNNGLDNQMRETLTMLHGQWDSKARTRRLDKDRRLGDTVAYVSNRDDVVALQWFELMLELETRFRESLSR